jgi:hypothetical protein
MSEIVAQKIHGITGWSLSEVVKVAEKWGAKLEDVAIEPSYVGNGITGTIMVWYVKK